jgi:enoyl-CoA hydratase/carnithine racemase
MELTASTIVVPALLTGESVRSLRAQIARRAHAGAGVLVLRGSEETFCAGLDFDDLRRADRGVARQSPDRGVVGRRRADRSPVHPATGETTRDAARTFADCLDALQRFPAPVIAVVTGPATAGGVGLVAAADLAIATEHATFALTELLFGLVPAIVTPPLLARLSPARLKLWAMTAERWDAHTAAGTGLVDVVVAAVEIDAALSSWARRLSRPNRDAVSTMKHLLLDIAAGQSPDVAALTAARLDDPDVRSAVEAFARDGVAPWVRTP